jgi:hypothetical protein
MGHWREQDEAGETAGIGEREGGRDRAAQRMSQQHEPLDAHAVQRLRDERGLAGRRSVLRAPRAVAPAVAGAIDQNDPAGLGQPVAEREPKVAEIAAGATHQHDRPVQSADPPPLPLAEFEDMKPSAIDLDKAAGRRVRRLDAPVANAVTPTPAPMMAMTPRSTSPIMKTQRGTAHT